jgi:hypothetical protein
MRLAIVLVSVVGMGGCSLPRAAVGGSTGNDAHSGIDGGAIDLGPMRDLGPTDDAFAIDMGGGVDAFEAGPIDMGPDAHDAAGGHDAFVCVDGAQRCHMGNTGVDTCTSGAWALGSMCPLGCMAMPAVHCATFDPANVSGVLTNMGPDVMISTATQVITDGCTGLGSAIGRVVAQPGGPMVCLFEVNTLTITSTGSVSAIGAYPLVIVSQGAVRIDGVLDASSYVNPMTPTIPHMGAGAGTGGHAGGDGIAGGSNTDGGGGGGGLGGSGGSGANEGMTSVGGAGGNSVTTNLSPLVGGASGGSGSSNAGANGGPGGGAIQISSYTTIAITGTVAAAGATGHGGDPAAGGGGGGSGGGILLEAASITLGTTMSPPSITVAGGGGGAAACYPAGGGPGTDGFYAGVGMAAGGTPPCTGAHDGGAGGGANAPNGANSMNGGGTNGSGGGGGAGIIVFRTPTNMVPMGTTDPTGGGSIVHDMLMVH